MSQTSTGESGTSWIYVMRNDDASGSETDYDLAWIYLDLTSPIYVYVMAQRMGVRRGKWMHAGELFGGAWADLIDLRARKISKQAGYSKMNTEVDARGGAFGGSLFVDMDLGATVTLTNAIGQTGSATPRSMVAVAFPDATPIY